MIAATAVLASCSRQEANIYRGYYSFKTGGYLEIAGKVYDIGLDTVSIDTTVTRREVFGYVFYDTTYNYNVVADTLGSRDTVFTRNLSHESGQMHILSAGENNVKVTMNLTAGNPIVFDAQAFKENLTLQPTIRPVTIIPDAEQGGQDMSLLMTVSGVGRKYENMVIFDLEYNGDYGFPGVSGKVRSSHVNCIATKNE